MKKFLDVIQGLLSLEKGIVGLVVTVLIFVGVIRLGQSCNTIHNNNTGIAVVEQLKTSTPTKDESKVIPAGDQVLGVVRLPKTPKVPVGSRAETSLVVSAQCNTCPAHYTETLRIRPILGLNLAPKLYIGYNLKGFTIGYDQEIFRYSRWSLDGLVSFPFVGAGVSYSVTRNFFVLAGANYEYLEYNTNDILGTMKPASEILPIGAIGFGF